MLAIIQFNPALGYWSAMIFWMVIVSIALTLGFTVVVFFGGMADLRYLLKAMGEEQVDETDDGRVLPADQKEPERAQAAAGPDAPGDSHP